MIDYDDIIRLLAADARPLDEIVDDLAARRREADKDDIELARDAMIVDIMDYLETLTGEEVDDDLYDILEDSFKNFERAVRETMKETKKADKRGDVEKRILESWLKGL